MNDVTARPPEGDWLGTPYLTFERRGPLAVVTVDRPEMRNAMSPAMYFGVRYAIDRVNADPALVGLLLTGTGDFFIPGGDLAGGGDDDWGFPTLLGMDMAPYEAFRTSAKPIVCAVNGVAAGAGANVALACDLVVAGRSASFLQAFARIGLMPDSGGTYFLPRLVGTARALGLALLADKLPAEEAARIGLIWKCVDDAQLMDEARAIAAAFGKGPTKAYEAIKEALYASPHNSLDAQLNFERDVQRELGRTEDYREGVTAFMEKRAPNFKGK